MGYTTRTMLALISAVLLLAAGLAAQKTDSAQALLRAATDKAVVDGDLRGAIKQYQTIVDTFKTDRAVVATALVRMAECYQKLGDAESGKIYERVTRDFADQTESAATARARLAAMQSAAVARVGQTVRLLWSDLGRPLDNSIVGPPSADGRYLSFSVGPEATGLAVLDLKTGKTLSYTNLGADGVFGDVESSVVSPDGRQVAYDIATYPGGVEEHELRVLQVNGGKPSKPHTLTIRQTDGTDRVVQVNVNGGIAAESRSVYLHHGEDINGGDPEVHGWSPDGKSVLVMRYQWLAKKKNLAIISIADSAVRVLKDNLSLDGESAASFSPDGRYVAYQRREEGVNANDIFVLSLDGKETRVMEAPGEDRYPQWSPDGSHIVFLSNRTGSISLWMIPVSGGTPSGPAKLVKANVGRFWPLGITRSGALYYIAGSDVTNIYTAELDAKLNAATAPSMATDQYLNSNRAGVWSPDGQSLAYVSEAPRGYFIRIRTMKTGEDREVPTQIQASGPVKWFPDGQSILVASRDVRLLNGDLGYYRINIASGKADLLHQTASRNVVSTRPDLSPDGKTIFYLETPGQLVRLDIDSHRETQLTPVGTGSRDRRLSLAVSPDGAQVAYVGGASLVVAPAAGGEPRELVRFSGGSSPRELADGLGLAWSPDQRYLFFVKPEIRGIWRVPLTGGEAENIGISMNRIRALRMHPDGRRIAFDSVIDAPSEVWVLENFLPKAGAAR